MEPKTLINILLSITGFVLIYLTNNINTRLNRIEEKLEIVATNTYRIDQLEKQLGTVNYPTPKKQPEPSPLFSSILWIVPDRNQWEPKAL